MNTAIPTPFDIIDPPPGAFVPSEMMWWALLGAAGCAFLLASLFNRRRKGRSIQSLLESLLAELRLVRQQAKTAHDLERVARLGRRILSPYLSSDAAALSSVELRELAQSLRTKNTDASQSLSTVVKALADVEDHAYAPALDSGITADAEAALTALVEQVDAHLRRYRLP